jgi:hypothetical protein
MEYETLFSDAVALFEKQKVWPKSPGTFVNGTMALCAASALAYVGFVREFGKAAADSKLKVVVSNNSKVELVHLFSELGWSAEIGWKVLGINDSVANGQNRKQCLREFLSTLALSDLSPNI